MRTSHKKLTNVIKMLIALKMKFSENKQQFAYQRCDKISVLSFFEKTEKFTKDLVRLFDCKFTSKN